ncbi:MAG: hypothetical protein M1412_01805 [Deltaproteobacteria bacterium]|nr:hypothetical protein [Deltaproteobacteria bacterium]MCL5891890.1 hypothetical protein [Deltaproteobacteria bacterium]
METDIFDLIMARYEIIDKAGLEKLICEQWNIIGDVITRDELLSLTNYIQNKALERNLIR